MPTSDGSVTEQWLPVTLRQPAPGPRTLKTLNFVFGGGSYIRCLTASHGRTGKSLTGELGSLTGELQVGKSHGRPGKPHKRKSSGEVSRANWEVSRANWEVSPITGELGSLTRPTATQGKVQLPTTYSHKASSTVVARREARIPKVFPTALSSRYSRWTKVESLDSPRACLRGCCHSSR